ncbi:MAG: hypothetical protein ACFKPT_20205 [Gloeotrichia echinulata GP01]
MNSIYTILNTIHLYCSRGDWGLGIGDWGHNDRSVHRWGLGIGDWEDEGDEEVIQCPMPNAQYRKFLA